MKVRLPSGREGDSRRQEALIDYVKEPHDGLVARATRRIIAELQGPEAVAALQEARRQAKAAEEFAKTITRFLAFARVERPELGEATGQAVFVRPQPDRPRAGLESTTRLEWRDNVLTHWIASEARNQWPTRPGGITPGFAAEEVAEKHLRPPMDAATSIHTAAELATVTINGIRVETLVLDQWSQMIGIAPQLQDKQFQAIAQSAGISYAHYRITLLYHFLDADPLMEALFPPVPGMRGTFSADTVIQAQQRQSSRQ